MEVKINVSFKRSTIKWERDREVRSERGRLKKCRVQFNSIFYFADKIL